jgi:hypothetical protein
MSRSKADILASLDSFTSGYIECALWSSTESDADGNMGEPLDDNYGPEDIALATLLEMVRDCKAFQRDNDIDLEVVATHGYSAKQAGHDFWLTRNGHGAGFWDRGLADIGDRLSKASKAYGSVDLMVHRRRVVAA